MGRNPGLRHEVDAQQEYINSARQEIEPLTSRNNAVDYQLRLIREVLSVTVQ